MDEFSAHLKSSLRISLLFLSLSLFAWALFPDYRDYLSGLLMGMVAGLLNALHLAWRIRRMTKAVLERTGGGRSLGFATRAALAVLAVYAAQRLGYSVIAAIAGLFLVQMATLVLGILSKKKG